MGNQDRNLKANLAASYNELVQSFTALSCETIGNYTLGKVIGKGSYGKAYQATHKFLGGKVVLKSTPKSEAPNLAREIHHHRRLHHPHVAQLYEVIITENKVWLVLELCANGELYEHLLAERQLSELETQRLFAQICGAVAYVHKNGIVHRDLKLENIFLDRKNNAKLGDFGFTRENDKPLLSTWCGSLSYCAPEIVRGDKYQGEAVDIWSLGIILFALLSGHLPFDEDNDDKTRKLILQEKQVYPPFFSDEVKELLDRMLSKQPEERPRAAEVLQHSFLSTQAEEQLFHLENPYTPTFTTKMERAILDRLHIAGIDTDKVMTSVNDYRCDSLCGWWWLSLQRERRREERYKANAKRRSVDHVYDSVLGETRSGRRRSRSRSRSRSRDVRLSRNSALRLGDYRFPSGSNSLDGLVSSAISPDQSTADLVPTTIPKPTVITFETENMRSTDPERNASREPSASPASQNVVKPSPDLTPTTSRHTVQDASESLDRNKELGQRKQGIMQTFKSWWSEQKMSKSISPKPEKSSPLQQRRVSAIKPIVNLSIDPQLTSPRPERPERPTLHNSSSRPSYRRRRSSQVSNASSRASSARPPIQRKRTGARMQLSTSESGVQPALRSPSPAQSNSASNWDLRPAMQRTISSSSAHSSVASFRGQGLAGHSKASSTSSNSTFASTRSIRSPRNPLKVMPSTPPPYMIAHKGGFKERNIFESALAGVHGPPAFATRKKAKRGVQLQTKKQGRRRVISLNDAEPPIEEEEEGEEGEEYEDLEVVNDTVSQERASRSLLDLAEEHEEYED